MSFSAAAMHMVLETLEDHFQGERIVRERHSHSHRRVLPTQALNCFAERTNDVSSPVWGHPEDHFHCVLHPGLPRVVLARVGMRGEGVVLPVGLGLGGVDGLGGGCLHALP